MAEAAGSAPLGGPAEGQKQRLHYRCFLLRCRLHESSGAGEPAGPTGVTWRFTVQEAGPEGARRSFTSLEDVEAYIAARLGLSGERAAGRAE
jgi:hypothetical protein